MTSISIIGAGMVGSTIAFNIMDLADSLELVDINGSLAQAETLDLRDARDIMGLKTRMRYSTSPGPADIYIICAGKRVEEGDNRNGPKIDNRKMVESLLEEISLYETDPWLFMVTNPSGRLAAGCYEKFRKVIACGRDLDRVRTRVLGSHEAPEISNHYDKIKAAKKYTNWAIAAEVRNLLMEVTKHE